ncbi:hypothetical protein A2415_05525 [candidate division WWE3 bacterium RIFOXYC1_FULL_39_7]|uniref:S-adenosylmethionine decarboxylase proenzyme n=2 Tax=Katanobacteria TaxID=422282 RepID=A0A1F4X848_UNCKA|nr:MAG: hypothetical protein A2415_05525 [candidate division WWE3 bacterium RIFOXYC1_FULL_39_7]OGC77875.1 MAG: hypothetical protein A2619_03660 [candidate division WWE3 bacterium RIFOXYD1_FULL_39_9]
MNQSTPLINHFVALIRLEGVEVWENVASDLAASIIQKLKLTVIKSDSHQFSPQGETRVYLLSQSHLAIHTWPEDGVVHVDLVSCSNINEPDFMLAIKAEDISHKFIEVKTQKVS